MSVVVEAAKIGVELTGRSFRLIGAGGPVTDAVSAALVAQGAQATQGLADLLIVSHPLLPAADGSAAVGLDAVAEAGRAMAEKGGGRIVFLLSALGALPMRRHVAYSAAMAAATAGMRGLAMQLAPKVLVNGVGAGAVEGQGGDLLAGDRQMLSHVSLGRAGGIEDVVNAVLFLCDPANTYTTGQLLVVDGGWSVGYGRNF
jgi:NAD(P)-dependent dehydrogenase (short-subunit alcohol dehydrogenase family)